MSRAYIIRISESERRFIHVEDSVATDIELLPILPPERLSELLATELEGRGFVVEEGLARRDDDGILLEVELGTGRITARVEHGAEVEKGAATNVRPRGMELEEGQEAEVRARLRAKLDEELALAGERLQREITGKLEAKLRDLQKEVDAVSNRVAGAALKEKAAQLGEILELSEDETGSMTIKVKV